MISEFSTATGTISIRRNLLRIGMAFALAALSNAVPLPAAAQIADEISERYSSWTVRCQSDANRQAQKCWIAQTLSNQQGGDRLTQAEIMFDQGVTKLALLAPFGLLLSEGARVSVTGGSEQNIGFRTCLPVGCILEASLTDEQVLNMRKGEKMTVRYTIADNAEVLEFGFSLAGFSAAMDRLEEFTQ